MSSPSKKAAKKTFVGCRYRLGADEGEVDRCTIQKGIVRLYRPNESLPFFTFHNQGMWWRNGDSITVFKLGADTLHLRGIKP